MTPKNKLFIGILAFMLIVNILVIFNLNYFYIRAILGFVFLITIPGLLIILCLKIRNINFWEYLVYTIGLSVSFIMFAGLAVNWILPWFNITDKPLSLYPILICFDTILLTLWLIAHKRNEDNVHLLIFPFDEYEKKRGKFNFIPKLTSFSWIDRIFIIIPFFFPVLAILGAFILNNNGPNYLTMIMLGGIAIYVLLVVIFRDKLNENVYPWAILMISLSILLSWWFRSWCVSGIDSNAEFLVFQITKNNFFWEIIQLRKDYSSMLSLTILPTILSNLLKVNDYFIFKLFFQIIFSFVPLIIFLIFKKFIKNIPLVFLGSLFFIIQPYFITIPIRQEIAFLFFSLMLLVLFSKEINPKIRNLLFVIFGFSMIISHYSTAYIALAIFLLTYIFILIYKILENRKIKKGKLKPEQKEQFYLTGIIILLLLVFGFLWYSQITPTADGLINFAQESISNMGNIFSEDVQAEGNSPLQNLLPFSKKVNYGEEWIEYNKKVQEDYNKRFSVNDLYPKEKASKIQPNLVALRGLDTKISYNINISLIKTLFEFLARAFIILGIFLFFIYSWKDKKKTLLKIIIISFLIFLVTFIFLPLFSFYYDLPRFYQQFLIILSLFSPLGLFFILKSTFKNKSYFIVALFFILYFLISLGVIYQLTGGINATMRLNNIGFEYDSQYSHINELKSASWFIKNNNGEYLYLDNYANLRFLLVKRTELKRKSDIIPSIIQKKSYVYSSYMNSIKEVTIKIFNGMSFSFDYPKSFLDYNKNKIYNNGGSEIFK